VRLKGDELFTYHLQLGNDAISYIGIEDYSNPSALVGSTFQNNIIQTDNHGETWNLLLSEGEF
jgi:hypothetical protein